MAVLNCTMNGLSDRRGVIYGPKGYIEIENINNFASVTVYDASIRQPFLIENRVAEIRRQHCRLPDDPRI